MKKFTPIIFAALLAAPSAYANSSYDYISGGFQLTNVDKDGFQEYFDGQYNNDSDKKLFGVYFKGSYNFAGNFFAEANFYQASRSSTDLTEGNLALGYFFPISESSSIYTTLGYSLNHADRTINKGCGWFDDKGECRTVTTRQKNSGITAEIGYRTKINSTWEIIPSYRITAAPKGGLHDLRLTNLVNITQHSAIELNAAYRKWDSLNEATYQIGYRYTF